LLTLSFLGLVLNGMVGFLRRRILFWDAASKAEAAATGAEKVSAL
jgi:hypothetical protein